MIVGQQKPLEEIRGLIEPYHRVCVLGCGTCTTICFAGGEREVAILASKLRLAERISGKSDRQFTEYTVRRQCEWEYLDEIADKIKEVDAVLSLACGVGVQAIAEHFPETIALPGLNTLFMGMPVEPGMQVEKCIGCGDCLLGKTAGICPMTACPKGLVNGACGGYRNGKCEVDPRRDCAWVKIYEKLKRIGQLDMLYAPQPLKDYGKMAHPRQIGT
jgi:ferredoxin